MTARTHETYENPHEIKENLMGGRQKRLTQARRKTLKVEMTDALVAGQFRLGEGQSLDSVLDEIDDGIKNDRYPIDVDLPKLMAIWSGTPAPAEAQTAAGSEQGAPPAAEIQDPIAADPYKFPHPKHADLEAAQQVADAGGTQMQVMEAAMGPAAVPGTVEHAQAQAAAASGASPTAQAILGTGPVIGTGNAIQNGHPAYSSAQLAVVQLNPDGTAVHPLPGPAAAPGPAPVTEVGVPAAAEVAPKEEKAPVVDVDLDAVRGWIQIARGAQKKIDAAKDVMDQAMSQVNDFLDQQGGPDVSKKGLLDGEHAVQRTFCRRKVFNKSALLTDHPEISEEQYTEKTPYYRTELK